MRSLRILPPNARRRNMLSSSTLCVPFDATRPKGVAAALIRCLQS